MDFEGDVEAKSWHRKLAVNYKRKYKDKKTQSEVKVLTLVAATAAVLVLVLLLVAGTRLVSKGKENRMKAKPWYKWIALKDEAEGKGVLIYSKSWCPYSQRAKRIFDELDTKYVAVELDQIEDGAKVQDALASITGIRTVPQVFVGGKLIGGHDGKFLSFVRARVCVLHLLFMTNMPSIARRYKRIVRSGEASKAGFKAVSFRDIKAL